MEGFIIAGGKSVRMGRPKADLTIGRETLIDRVANAL
ncbi:MAG: NTP transferase domain-containing protein, partial [Pyrinomonadaceae bacterium]